ncbi:MAG: hypothetical protein KGH72_03800 [Candidatus Micrarchaeota archaeon]|nr:hypothetical protein [Candidatus Micrarchaeota archaeon]
MIAGDGKELVAELRKLGFGPGDVFFKGIKSGESYRYWGSGITSVYRGTSDKPFWPGEEFRALSALHDAAPDGVVMPIAVVKGRDSSRPVGYVTEIVLGNTLDNYVAMVAKGVFPKEGHASRLERTVEVVTGLHAQGLAHGDLHGGNILITGSGVKLSDPRLDSSATLASRIHNDRLYLRTYRERAESIRASLRRE